MSQGLQQEPMELPAAQIDPRAALPQSVQLERGLVSTRSKFLRVLAGCLLVLLLFKGIAAVREYQQAQTLSRHLVGVWSEDILQEDGRLVTWMTEIRKDGTFCFYPQNEPVTETGNDNEHMRWHVSHGELVITWDHHFTQTATAGQRLRQVKEVVTNQFRNNAPPLYYSSRYLVRLSGADTITLTLHEDDTTGGIATRPQFTIERARGGP